LKVLVDEKLHECGNAYSTEKGPKRGQPIRERHEDTEKPL
jgi:hypothetical protein